MFLTDGFNLKNENLPTAPGLVLKWDIRALRLGQKFPIDYVKNREG